MHFFKPKNKSVSVKREFNLAPAVTPPANLMPHDVPQFICLGFDDNSFDDSLEWLSTLFSTMKNPIGTNNPKTFDGTNINATFFQTGRCINTPEADFNKRVASWLKKLHFNGHEIGNHSFWHTKKLTTKEIRECEKILKKFDIVDKNEIYGARSPFLSYSEKSIKALYNEGYLYDCSIEQELTNETQEVLWPFTLDNGFSQGPRPIKHKYPGMWEVPVNYVKIPGKMKFHPALDFNLWAYEKQTKDQFVNTLKYNLDRRISGNRAPFTLGMHSDEYSGIYKYFDTEPGVCTGWQERREAIKEFLEYALTIPEVRIVSFKKLIDWMTDPVSLSK